MAKCAVTRAVFCSPSRTNGWSGPTALAPIFFVNDIGTGPMDFGFTADIRIAPTALGCDYAVAVHHATPQAASAHDGMGFYSGWGTAADQLGRLAATL